MPITRLYNYIPGSLARGEDVSDEYDSIIAFINGLETDKLDAVGGTVSNLTVSGSLNVVGATNLGGDVTLETGIDIRFSDTGELLFGNPTAGVVISKADIDISTTSFAINFTGSNNSINFANTGGVVLGSSANITTPSNSFGEASGLVLNHATNSNVINILGSTLLDKLKIKTGHAGGGYFEVSKTTTTHATLKIMAVGLPTADPGVPGQIWNDANTLKVSP